MLCSKVLVTLADHLCLLCFFASSQWTNKTVCRTSDSSYNLTNSSLVTVDFQQSFMASDFFVCSKMLIMHVRHTCAWYVTSSRAVTQLAFLWLLQTSRARFIQHWGLSTIPSHYYTTQYIIYYMCTCIGWIASKCAEGFAQ